LTEEPDA